MDVLEHEKKKLKEWFIRKRNKRDRIIHKHLDHIRHEAERQHDMAEQMTPKSEASGASSELWSAKTQDVRNKLTGKKRDAKDRWNRFAGTEDGGGRGL